MHLQISILSILIGGAAGLLIGMFIAKKMGSCGCGGKASGSTSSSTSLPTVQSAPELTVDDDTLGDGTGFAYA